MRRVAITILILILLAGAFGLWLRGELRRPYRGYSQQQIFVDIPRGTPRWNIAGLLQRNGVIDSRVPFIALSLRHRHRVLQAGEYLFNQPMTPRQVFEQIAGGHIFVHVVVVPEGWTMFDIANELARQGLATKEDFLRVARDPLPVKDIAPRAPSLEGFLFPSTYQFSRNASAEEIAGTMVRQFRDEWSTLQASVPPPTAPDPIVAGHPAAQTPGSVVAPLSPEQLVTLASLVERETPQPSERPMVASVFYNRLKLGVPLQCDPTVQYALDLASKPTLKVTPDDLHIVSSYNTYLHRGLPPGPIANPGDASLRAVLNPAHTKYLYFVANDSGGHFFASTLEEHNRNVARYRRLLQGLPAELPPPSPHKNAVRTRGASHKRSLKKQPGSHR
ncbi:MAG TPA: endolytic transglycosylase MltG [Candidatus Acidoferrales bacterium]|nr:endolytic transglycosylase MltG [Candidatus Acidoferrales bacterium]